MSVVMSTMKSLPDAVTSLTEPSAKPYVLKVSFLGKPTVQVGMIFTNDLMSRFLGGMLALRRGAVEVTHEDFMDGIQEVQAKKKMSLQYYA
jgi:hypothetical protein